MLTTCLFGPHFLCHMLPRACMATRRLLVPFQPSYRASTSCGAFISSAAMAAPILPHHNFMMRVADALSVAGMTGGDLHLAASGKEGVGGRITWATW